MYISSRHVVIILGLIILLVVGGLLLRSQLSPDAEESITSFEECVAAGYPIALSIIPARCTTPDGRVFTQEAIGEQEKNHLTETTGREHGRCIITGCSGQVCADADVITTCEYKPEYACYSNAVCERQADGQCGWTLTAAVGRCLQEMGSGGESQVPGSDN